MTAIEPLAAVRAVHIASTVAMTGAFAFRFIVAPRAAQRPRVADGPAEALDRWTMAWCGAVLAIAGASWLAWLVLTASRMSGMSVARALDADVLRTVLADTTFGRIWVARSICMLALAACLAARRFERRHAGTVDATAASLTVLLAVTLAAAGHAGVGALSGRVVHVATDALHVLGAGGWLGALVPLVFALGRAAATGDRSWHALAAIATRRFSALGVLAVAVLLATGLLNAGWLVGSWTGLRDTTYGRLVAVKAALFVLALAIAAVNRLVLTPQLPLPATGHVAVGRLWRNAIAELAIGVVLVALVGVLGMIPPPGRGHSDDMPEMRSGSASATEGPSPSHDPARVHGSTFVSRASELDGARAPKDGAISIPPSGPRPQE